MKDVHELLVIGHGRRGLTHQSHVQQVMRDPAEKGPAVLAVGSST